MKPFDTLYVCGLCEKFINEKDPRVNFGRKAYHGSCFVEHCKKSHTKKYDHEEADAMETLCTQCQHPTREHDAGWCYRPGCQCPKNGKGHEPGGNK